MRHPPYKRVMVNGRRVVEHVAIVERVLGKRLPKGAQVHHVDSDGWNNAHSNLVVCPSQAYHRLLHTRTEALEACGNASWLQCRYCKEWDDPQNLCVYMPARYSWYRAHHRACHAAAETKRYREGLRA